MTETRGIARLELPCYLGRVGELRTHEGPTRAAIGYLESLSWRWPSSDALWAIAAEPFVIYAFPLDDLPVIEMPRDEFLNVRALPDTSVWNEVCLRASSGEISGLHYPSDNRLVLAPEAVADIEPLGQPMHTSLSEFIPDYLFDVLGPPPPEVRRDILG